MATIMRYWAPLFHFYQPSTQHSELTQHVLESCYIPVTEILLANPRTHITANLSGSLILKLQELKAERFFTNVKELLQRGQIELVNSPMYHPLIPLSPYPAIQRQLKKNQEILTFHFQQDQFAGVFPPELAVTNEVLSNLATEFSWCIIDESSINRQFDLQTILSDQLYQRENSTLIVSSRAITETIRAYPSQINSSSLINFFQQTPEQQVIFSAHDVEVFGHHYEERIHLFEELVKSEQLTCITISEGIERSQATRKPIESITASSWQTNPAQLEQNNPFPMWYSPENHLQTLYSQLMALSYEAFSVAPKPENDVGLLFQSAQSAQNHYDQGIASCYPYWLSNRPWWHPELVESGARHLMKAIRTLPVDRKTKQDGENLYVQLIHDLWEFHWSGQVEENFKNYERERQERLKLLPNVS
jgi:hypothetical protein